MHENSNIPNLTQIINKFFEEKMFPDDLIKTKVNRLHMDGSKLVENNYRPASLLIVWSKIIDCA